MKQAGPVDTLCGVRLSSLCLKQFARGGEKGKDAEQHAVMSFNHDKE
jgi:hypothetical protein